MTTLSTTFNWKENFQVDVWTVQQRVEFFQVSKFTFNAYCGLKLVQQVSYSGDFGDDKILFYLVCWSVTAKVKTTGLVN